MVLAFWSFLVGNRVRLFREDGTYGGGEFRQLKSSLHIALNQDPVPGSNACSKPARSDTRLATESESWGLAPARLVEPALHALQQP